MNLSIFQKGSVIHYSQFGVLACGVKVTRDPDLVTCHACRAGIEAAGIGILTFEIDPEGKWIRCLGCGLTSYSSGDVSHHYCGHCHVFHDDIWPPARKWWIENTPKVVDAKGRRIKQ